MRGFEGANDKEIIDSDQYPQFQRTKVEVKALHPPPQQFRAAQVETKPIPQFNRPGRLAA